MRVQRIYYIVGVLSPETCMPVYKKILTRLYRVFVHLYVVHFDAFLEIKQVKTFLMQSIL